MAQELDDGEFWLPSEFLTDDDLLTDFNTDRFNNKISDEFSYGLGKPFGFHSVLSSPVESVMGSTETESDEDDFVIGLTRKMAYSTLQDFNLSSEYATKGLKLSGSPQSTLCGCKPGSSRGSPNCVSQVSSPPDAKDGMGWDLLSAAAGEVARMRMIEETTVFYSTKVLAPALKPCPVAAPRNITNSGSGFYPNQTQAQFSYQQLQSTRFEQMKQQEMMKSGVWGQRKVVGYQFLNTRNEAGRPQGSSTGAWPTLQQSQRQLQQQPGSGMRPVFLGETGAKRERTGTGVFLPRRFATSPPVTRKKPAAAMNLNLEDAQPLHNGNPKFTPDYGVALKTRNNIGMAQQRRILRPAQAVMNQELRLPQEWTY